MEVQVLPLTFFNFFNNLIMGENIKYETESAQDDENIRELKTLCDQVGIKFQTIYTDMVVSGIVVFELQKSSQREAFNNYRKRIETTLERICYNRGSFNLKNIYDKNIIVFRFFYFPPIAVVVKNRKIITDLYKHPYSKNMKGIGLDGKSLHRISMDNYSIIYILELDQNTILHKRIYNKNFYKKNESDNLNDIHSMGLFKYIGSGNCYLLSRLTLQAAFFNLKLVRYSPSKRGYVAHSYKIQCLGSVDSFRTNMANLMKEISESKISMYFRKHLDILCNKFGLKLSNNYERISDFKK